MANQVYVLGGLARMLLDFLDERALELKPLRETLGRVQIGERVPIETWWGWLDVVQGEVPQPGLGLHIGRCARIHHVGLLGYLLRACGTVGEAFEHFRRFQPLLHNLNPITVSADNEQVHVSWDPEYGKSVQVANEVLVSAFITIIKTLAGETGNPALRIDFPRPSPYGDLDLGEIADCPVAFNAESLGVWLPRDCFALPVATADADLRTLLVSQAEAQMETTPQPDRFIEQLHVAILRCLVDGEAGSVEVSRAMKMPLRTFYRRLKQHGVNFGDQLRAIRYRLAKQYLGDPSVELVEVAALVGYADQSTFSRAFKRWNGCSPLAFRKAVLEKH